MTGVFRANDVNHGDTERTENFFFPEERGPAMRIVPVTPSRWPDVEKLFGPRGAYSNCWCMWPRMVSRDFDAATPAQKKRGLKRTIEKGPPPALLAYEGKEPVAWVAIAPREATPRLARSRVAKSPDGAPAWAITCYFVRADKRGTGLMGALTNAAVAYAKKQGATLVEAFPVIDTSFDGCDGFQGVASTLETCGFEEVARPSANRAYMRRSME